jgi:hypothetical protein
MQGELERGHDAEVAAAAPQRPQQVGVLVRAGAHQLSVGGHELGGEQVVAGEPVLALEPARAAAQREPGHAGRGDAASGGGELVGLAGAVDVGPGRTAADAGDSPRGVDLDGVQAAQVDDEAAVAQRPARHGVSARSHR